VPDYDAILVPGGGVREGGVLPSWVRCRLDLAIERSHGAYIITLSAGTTHRPPPLDERGFPIFEATAAANYLIDAGVPANQILTETHSSDTIGNAFFSRVLHADPRELRRLLVITSDFHVERTRMAFDWVYGLTPAAGNEIDYEGILDPNMDPDLFRARQTKERKSLAALAPLTQSLTTIKDFHHWLFTEHSAYRSLGPGRSPDPGRSRSPGEVRTRGEALDSY
jgi:hypothetical protein